jgi:hypothetical protein
MDTKVSSKDRIRAWNDHLRQLHRGGKVLLTRGVSALEPAMQQKILRAIASFTDFTTDNDPYGEHDCAIVSVGDHRVMFKIDYYDPSLLYASEDPADPAKTVRVMTVLLTEEY